MNIASLQEQKEEAEKFLQNLRNEKSSLEQRIVQLGEAEQQIIGRTTLLGELLEEAQTAEQEAQSKAAAAAVATKPKRK